MNQADPFGLCPPCVGAVIGAGLEATVQIRSGDLNWRAIAWSGLMGGLSGGFTIGPALGKLGLHAGISALDSLVREGLYCEDVRLDRDLLERVALNAIMGGFGGAVSSRVGRSLSRADHTVILNLFGGRRLFSLGTAGDLSTAVSFGVISRGVDIWNGLGG